jgi:hypothetical protein
MKKGQEERKTPLHFFDNYLWMVTFRYVPSQTDGLLVVQKAKEKKLKLEETEASHTLGGAGEGRVQVRGKWRGCRCYSAVTRPIGLAESATWARFRLRKKTMNLCASVSEELGHGEGVGVYATEIWTFLNGNDFYDSYQGPYQQT